MMMTAPDCASYPLPATAPDCAYIIKRLYSEGDPAEVPASGPAPVLLRFNELATLVPAWEVITAAIEADKEAVKKLGEA